ncbi:winged helix-turn-helix transcriptional regulator [Lactiplantibacillus plantarum]
MLKERVTAQPRYRNEFDATMQLIRGKWKIMILFELAEVKVSRFADLQHHIQAVSHKTLASQLKELEQDELIERHDFKTAQQHVEYRLTAKGQSLIPILDAICTWGDQHVDPALIERSLCDE